MLGQTLGPYKIEEKLGEGGMGVVYRARDTRLDRPVALKVLRAETIADPDRKRRFIQEARAASSLNHPNIVTIYDIGEEHGVDYIAMEYIAGRTLDACFGRQGSPLAEALKYAIQIADVLVKAHGAGIIHRDLKPANIMVTAEGLVKVLDFGLAKLAERAGDDQLTQTLGRAPLTEAGAIVGTAAYMSPEQAQGRPLDSRSDLFSFGSVLYEMIAGRRPFQGDNKMSLLTALLRDEPAPLSQVREGTPAELERIVSRCLRKDPDRRFQTAADLKVALLEIKEESESGRLAAPAIAPGRPRRRLWIAAPLLVAATAAVTWWIARPPAPAPTPVLTRLTSDAGLTTDPDLSANGSLLAFASDRGGEGNLDIWVQPLPGGEAVRITRHQADDRQPAFSPDGARIAFRSERDGGGIWVIPALGGAERLLARQGREPRFSPDGQWLAYVVGNRGVSRKTYVIPAAGGTPTPVQPGFSSVSNPVWSPDGKKLLFTAIGEGSVDADAWVVPIPDGPAVRTGAFEALRRRNVNSPLPARWVAAGNYVIFSARLGDTTNLWRIAISPRTGKVTGEPERLTSGAGDEGQPAVSGARMIFSTRHDNLDLWSLPLEASQGRVLGPPQQLTQDAGRDFWGTLSADGRKLCFLSDRNGNPDVWLKDLATGRETTVIGTPASKFAATISPDGARIAYCLDEKGKRPAYVLAASGGVPEKIAADIGTRLWDWSPDGSRLLFSRSGPFRIYLLELPSGRETQILKHPRDRADNPRFSPDGRWLAFMTWTGADRGTQWVAPLPEGQLPSPLPEDQWIRVTDGSSADIEMCWAPDGNRLYFTSERDGFLCLWTQRLDPATKRPLGAPEPLQHFHTARRPMNDIRMPIRLSAARDKLIFELHEITGNIWMADFTPPAAP